MDSMTLRVPVSIKSKVTESLKSKIIADLKSNLEHAEQDLQQHEFRSKQMLTQQAQANPQELPQLGQYLEGEKQRLQSIKGEVAARLQEAEKLEIGSEISAGSMEQTITVKVGDDLDAMLSAEILLEDGKIIAFRK